MHPRESLNISGILSVRFGAVFLPMGIDIKNIWSMMTSEAANECVRDPDLRIFLEQHIINHDDFSSSLAMLLSVKLG